MRIERVQIENFRIFADAEWRPKAGINLLVGENGAGKTSVLEALHIMAFGRSFRGRIGDGLVRRGSDALQVVIEWQDAAGDHVAGLRHTGSDWQARLDRVAISSLAELCEAVRVLTYEPSAQRLVSGPADIRRRFLDWLLFHVEPGFFPEWRRYTRALRQRNAVLRSGADPNSLLPWEMEMAESGERLHVLREQTCTRLTPILTRLLALLAPELGEPRLRFKPGWREGPGGLLAALAEHRVRDASIGYSEIGTHRFDWRLTLSELDARTMLSRGQEKLAGLACVLAQAIALNESGRGVPVLCLDDLPSELDRNHVVHVLDVIQGMGNQVLMSGIEAASWLPDAVHVFHVEHGSIRPRI